MNRPFRGYTLIETLVVITIISIIMLFAHNNVTAWLKAQNAYRITRELVHLVHYSRAYAIHNRRPLTFCGSSDGQSCNNQWTSSALLFEDGNRNGIIDNADRIIKNVPFNIKGHLIWKGFSGQRMIFENIGITSASNGSFTYCELDKNPLYSRQVIVSRGGRARLSQDKNSDGFHEDVNGSIIKCPN